MDQNVCAKLLLPLISSYFLRLCSFWILILCATLSFLSRKTINVLWHTGSDVGASTREITNVNLKFVPKFLLVPRMHSPMRFHRSTGKSSFAIFSSSWNLFRLYILTLLCLSGVAYATNVSESGDCKQGALAVFLFFFLFCVHVCRFVSFHFVQVRSWCCAVYLLQKRFDYLIYLISTTSI